MTLLGVRRAAVLTSITGLVVSGVALSAAPVGAAPQRAAAPSAKIVNSYLVAVSVVPKSTTTWVLGEEQTSTTSRYFVAKRTGSHFAKEKIAKVGTYESITGLAAASSKSVFLIGSASLTTGSVPLVMRSSGGAFRRMTLPKGITSVNAISASSGTNVWALVSATKTVKGQPTYYTALMRWNGHSWHVTLVPKSVFGTAGSIPGVISTAGPTSTWLVLNTGTTKGTESLRFTGHKFVKTPIKLPANSGVSAIVAGSAKSVWVYGAASLPSGASESITSHFTGKAWHGVVVPKVGYYFSGSSLAAVGTHAYLVGSWSPKTSPKGGGLASYAFALTYQGGKWRTVSHVKRGVTSGLRVVAASSKLAVAAGTSYNGYQCTAKPVTATNYLVSIHSVSGSISLSPTVRTANRFAPAIGYTPNRPAC